MQSSTSRFDAVVVGARAAGAATAMLLARNGQRVLLLDRGRFGADTLSTHALMRGAVIQLHRWGLLDRIVAAGTPAIRRTTFDYGTDRVEIAIKPAHGVDALYAPRRTVLDPVLVDAAAEAGADVRFGATVRDVRRDRRGRVVGVTGRDAAGRRFVADATIVIGADGLRSTIASRVDAPIVRAGTGATAVVYGYWSNLPADGYEWFFRPRAAAGVIPTNGGQACVFAGTSPARLGIGRIGSLQRILEEASPELAVRVEEARGPTDVRSFPGRPGFVRRSWGPGWALVGDAGYWKDPLSAHGLTDALRDAELLARAVLAGSGTDTELLAALEAYQDERDRLSAELFAVVDEIASQRWTEHKIPELLLRLSASMVAEVDAIAALDAAAAR
jgi:2-polyprenyl-6-methoxyphenol hydroxylase-like FAD-dependent oxidoreductase